MCVCAVCVCVCVFMMCVSAPLAQVDVLLLLEPRRHEELLPRQREVERRRAVQRRLVIWVVGPLDRRRRVVLHGL